MKNNPMKSYKDLRDELKEKVRPLTQEEAQTLMAKSFPDQVDVCADILLGDEMADETMAWERNAILLHVRDVLIPAELKNGVRGLTRKESRAIGIKTMDLEMFQPDKKELHESIVRAVFGKKADGFDFWFYPVSIAITEAGAGRVTEESEKN